MTSKPSLILQKIIFNICRFYQYFLSPFLGNNCRFYPSCSDYLHLATKNMVYSKAFGSSLKELQAATHFPLVELITRNKYE